MNATDIIRAALQLTDKGIANLVADLRDKPLTRATPNGNHPMWIMGHLAFIEGTLRPTILGETNPVEHWAPLFAAGTQPSSDPSVYPPFETVLNKFHELRTGTLRMLDQVGEEGLGRKPKAVPPGFEEAMPTIGHTFNLIALHHMVHYGQIADARRTAGLKPLF